MALHIVTFDFCGEDQPDVTVYTCCRPGDPCFDEAAQCCAAQIQVEQVGGPETLSHGVRIPLRARLDAAQDRLVLDPDGEVELAVVSNHDWRPGQPTIVVEGLPDGVAAWQVEGRLAVQMQAVTTTWTESENEGWTTYECSEATLEPMGEPRTPRHILVVQAVDWELSCFMVGTCDGAGCQHPANLEASVAPGTRVEVGIREIGVEPGTPRLFVVDPASTTRAALVFDHGTIQVEGLPDGAELSGEVHVECSIADQTTIITITAQEDQ